MFLLLNEYAVDETTLATAHPAHVAWFVEQVDAGRVVMAGRQVPPVGGVIILHVATRAEAESFAANDPYALAGYATYRVIEFHAGVTRPELLAPVDPPQSVARG